MDPNMKPIIVIGTIGNQAKQIILTKVFPHDSIYNVEIDGKWEAQVIRHQGGWKVHPAEGSWLKGQDCDVILQAVKNAEPF